MSARATYLSPWVLLFAAALSSTSHAQDNDRREALLGNPQYIEPAVAPQFVELTPEELRGALKVVASRNAAAFGFNTPELQLHLPVVDNSTYAIVEMPAPQLLGPNGKTVAFELERGLHDWETQVAEIRFLAEDGRKPAEFVRAVGEITLRYPLSIETRTVEATQTDRDYSIDGPFVEVVYRVLVPVAPFSPIEPIRAYDSAGRQLRKSSDFASRWDNDERFETFSYYGEIARLEVDRVARLATVRIRYDVPVADLLPQGRQGTSVDERKLEQHPDTELEIEIEETR